jgi:hypothetical protein
MSSPKTSKTKDPDKKLTPVLIIPGFMSSVLEVQSSTLQPSWKNQRLWLNITTLGFNSITRGGKLQRNEEIRSTKLLNAEETGKEEALDPSVEQMHAEYLKQVECKNKWVQHMKLGDDMISEREGVVVRAIQGTAGKHMCYCFGMNLIDTFVIFHFHSFRCGLSIRGSAYRVNELRIWTSSQSFTICWVRRRSELGCSAL